MGRRLAIFLLASVAVAALLVGGTMGGIATAKSTPERTVTVTLADNGHRYTLRKGDTLDVELTGPSSYVTWNEPVSSNPAVLELTGGSSGTIATATFVADAKGKAEVTATGTLVCSSVCAGPAVPVFQVTVKVVG